MRLAERRVSPTGGFSLVEILVSVAIMAAIASIAMVAYSNVLEKSRLNLAKNVLETMNTGLKNYGQQAHRIETAEADTATTDEFLVLRTLQWKDPVSPILGSPFVKKNWDPDPSAEPEDYRIRWTGQVFELLEPTVVGSGIKLVFDGSDQTPYSHPLPYTPE